MGDTMKVNEGPRLIWFMLFWGKALQERCLGFQRTFHWTVLIS